MTFFPSREVFLQIGGISIRWYAICILTGALVAIGIATRDGKKYKYDSEVFDDLFIGCLSIGILGARLWYVLFYHFKNYLADPVTILYIWDGGLAIQGGLITGTAFAYVYCKLHRYSFLRIADLVVPNVLLAQAFGRWGNFANGECYGQIVDESFYDGILSFIKDGMYIGGQYREPMFFFESTLCLLGFVLIKLYQKSNANKRGDGIFCYLAWYGAIRFWIESRRTDSLMIGNFRVAQLVSIAFLAIGILGLTRVLKNITRENKPSVVFDLDCTLVNTYDCICASFEHVFAKYAPDYKLTDKEKADFCGPTLETTFTKYFPDGNIEEMVEMYRKYNFENHDRLVHAYPNAKEMLQYLKDNGYRIAIASSKATNVIKESLRVAGIADYFDDEQIIGYEKVIFPKPNPDVIFMALKKIGGSKDNAIYIGDSSEDVAAAKNAGVYSIAYCTNEYKREALEAEKPNESINDLMEITNIIKGEHPWTYNMK